MDQDESVDDPVEDAALLDDSCEIKRDSICVVFTICFWIVVHGSYRFGLVCSVQSKEAFAVSYGRSGWQGLLIANRRGYNPQPMSGRSPGQCVWSRFQLYRRVSGNNRYEWDGESVEYSERSVGEDSGGTWRGRMDSLAQQGTRSQLYFLVDQCALCSRKWLLYLELVVALRQTASCTITKKVPCRSSVDIRTQWLAATSIHRDKSVL